MIAAVTFFQQPSDLVYSENLDTMQELHQILDKNAFSVYQYIKSYGLTGHRIFRFKPEEVMRALKMSRYSLRKAMIALQNVFGVKFGPINDWQMELPEGQLSPAPTPRTGKRAKRKSPTSLTPPAPAVEPPQPELATMSDAPAQLEPAAENTPPAPAAESPQPELATMSDAPAQLESLTENTPPAPAVESPQPELATTSDAPAQAEPAAENTPPAPAAESQSPEIYIYKESESPELPETAVQALQEVELSPETASAEQVSQTQNPEAGMSATPQEKPAQTSVELDDAPHPAEEEAAPSPMVGTDSGPSAGGSQAPAEHKPQVMQELREKFLAAATLAELKQIKAAYGDEISNAVWKQLIPEEKEKIRAIVQRDSQQGAQAEQPTPAPAAENPAGPPPKQAEEPEPAPAAENPAGPPPKQAEQPSPAPAAENSARQRLKRGTPVQIWRRGDWIYGYRYIGQSETLANNERTGQLEIAHLVENYLGDLFEVAENNIRLENSA
ncbi:hypothetical protein [Kamptonema formosum]|uniref:hypothetical protein n=1 Tax=Kamptonema formosum TaxID=331992 RepID=UPI00037D0BB9|nr:hypothetical protein [Oscillatoria sp. PCC 10802]